MWTPEYFVRLVPFPASVEGVTVPNDDGTFDIYLNADLCEARMRECLEHEIKHIMEDHFYQESKSVTQLEQEANTTLTQSAPALDATYMDKAFDEKTSSTTPQFSSLPSFVFAMRGQRQYELQQSAG